MPCVRAPLRRGSSTMDVLHELAADGAEAGTAVVAGEQGRGARIARTALAFASRGSLAQHPVPAAGRRGRRALQPAGRAGRRGGDRGRGARGRWTSSGPTISCWRERKLGGILCEARWQGDLPGWVVVGHRHQRRQSGSGGARRDRDHAGRPAARSHPRGGRTVRDGRLRALDQPSERLSAAELVGLRRRDWLCGRRLREPARGTAAGIAEDGALLVRADRGGTVALRARQQSSWPTTGLRRSFAPCCSHSISETPRSPSASSRARRSRRTGGSPPIPTAPRTSGPPRWADS